MGKVKNTWLTGGLVSELKVDPRSRVFIQYITHQTTLSEEP